MPLAQCTPVKYGKKEKVNLTSTDIHHVYAHALVN